MIATNRKFYNLRAAVHEMKSCDGTTLCTQISYDPKEDKVYYAVHASTNDCTPFGDTIFIRNYSDSAKMADIKEDILVKLYERDIDINIK